MARGPSDAFEVLERRHTLHLRTRTEEVHWAFDPAGRLHSGHRGQRHFQVGLDGSVLERRGSRGAGPPRRLDPAEADALFDGVAADARSAWTDGAPELLAQIGARGAEAYRADRAAFRRVYGPVPILPPDCYRALLLQITLGCSYGGCAFCTLYDSIGFRIKGAGEVAQHVRDVAELLGPAAVLRNRLFLGDANALLAPPETLLAALAAARAAFPVAARGGAHTFVDAFSRSPSSEVLEALKAGGLTRVVLGLETGHAPLLKLLRKPGTPAQAIALAQRAKAAGLGVAAIALVGLGHDELGRAHVRDTVATIDAMGLEGSDTVFLSPLRDPPPTLPALPDPGRAAQAEALREGLRDLPPKVALYDLLRWVY